MSRTERKGVIEKEKMRRERERNKERIEYSFTTIVCTTFLRKFQHNNNFSLATKFPKKNFVNELVDRA